MATFTTYTGQSTAASLTIYTCPASTIAKVIFRPVISHDETTTGLDNLPTVVRQVSSTGSDYGALTIAGDYVLDVTGGLNENSVVSTASTDVAYYLTAGETVAWQSSGLNDVELNYAFTVIEEAV